VLILSVQQGFFLLCVLSLQIYLMRLIVNNGQSTLLFHARAVGPPKLNGIAGPDVSPRAKQ